MWSFMTTFVCQAFREAPVSCVTFAWVRNDFWIFSFQSSYHSYHGNLSSLSVRVQGDSFLGHDVVMKRITWVSHSNKGDLIQEISLDVSRDFSLCLHKHFPFKNTHLSFSTSHRTDWSWQSYKHELAPNQNPSASCLKRQESMRKCISFLKKGKRMEFLNTYPVLPTESDNLQSLIVILPTTLWGSIARFSGKKIGRVDSALCVCPVNYASLFGSSTHNSLWEVILLLVCGILTEFISALTSTGGSTTQNRPIRAVDLMWHVRANLV